MDIASYFNEAMLDNAHPIPGTSGIKCYMRNCLSDRDLDVILESYLEPSGQEDLPQLREEVHRCIVLNNFLGGIWAIQMLKVEDYGRGATEVFNFDLARARIEMYRLTRSFYFNNR